MTRVRHGQLTRKPTHGRLRDEALKGLKILTEIDSARKQIDNDPNLTPAQKATKHQQLNVIEDRERAAYQATKHIDGSSNSREIGDAERAYTRTLTDCKYAVQSVLESSDADPASFHSSSNQPKTNAGSSSPQATSSADSSELTNNPAKMFELLQKDPKALADALNKLDFGEKTIAQQSFQLFMQGQNRVESMISNAQKNAHDTQKAIISNMRV